MKRRRLHGFATDHLIKALDARALQLLFYLQNRAGSDNATWVSQKRIGADIGMGKNAVPVYLRQLQQRGIIKRYANDQTKHQGAIEGKLIVLQPAESWQLEADEAIPETGTGAVPETGTADPRNRDRRSPKQGSRYIGRNRSIEKDPKKKDAGGKPPAPSTLDLRPTDPIPEHFLTDEFKAAWERWTELRASQAPSKRIKQEQIDRARAKVAQWGNVDDCIEIMLEPASDNPDKPWIQLRTPKQMGKEWMAAGYEKKSKSIDAPDVGF